MAANNFSLAGIAKICDPNTGIIDTTFYRYLLGLNKTAGDAVAGEVATDPGSGLTGGGVVADGLTLALDPTDPRNVDHSAVSILAGVGLSGGGTIAVTRTIDLENTAVTPGSYTLTNLTVDAQGRITAAVNGTAPAAAWGTITGTLSTQTDLQTALDAKVDEVASTDNAIVRFNGTGGAVQDSAATVADTSGDIATPGTIKTGVFTVATLPAVGAGKSAFVSDALAPAFGVAVAGGGAVFIPVYSDGAGWFVG